MKDNFSALRWIASKACMAIFFSSVLLCSCTLDSKERAQKTKLRQYYIKGEELYKTHCQNCHQADGTGLGGVYPPLRDSDYLLNHRDDVICLIRFGKQGEIVVNGRMYNMQMPPQPNLSDLEVAEIATYIYNSWGNEGGLFDVKDVSPVLDSCR